MDGTISELLRQVERRVCMKAFVNHRPVLNDLLKRNFNNVGILPSGVTFQQGPSHGSGCSATSTFQTLRAAFTAYLAYRRCSDSKGYVQPQDAFSRLGIHLGDDGLDPNLPTREHQWAASKVGLELEAFVVDRGQRGVTFLARYYSPEVWFGRLDSMCDVKRQLSKFHTTVRLQESVTAAGKLVEKSRGYVATDGNTPVIGEICKRAITLGGGERIKFACDLKSWWSKFEASVQFPNSNQDGWMDAEFEIQFPDFDRKIFDEWLRGVKYISNLLKAPLCVDTKRPKRPVVDIVVDNDVMYAEASKEKTSAKTESTPVKTQRRAPKKKNTRKRKPISGKIRPSK